MVSHTIIVSTLTNVRPTVAARKIEQKSEELESDSDAIAYLWVGIIHSVEEIWCLVIPSWLCAGA